MAKPKAPQPPADTTERATYGSVVSVAREKCAQIMELYALGDGFDTIAKKLDLPFSGMQLRECIRRSADLIEAYNLAREARVHHMVEKAIEWGYNAAKTGDLRLGVDVMFKAAAKLSPAEYGDKQAVELTGKGGGPVAVVNMSDEELARIAAQGAKKASK